MILFDKPANNLNFQNVEILTNSIKDYHGTLMVISHDEVFLEEMRIDQELKLD